MAIGRGSQLVRASHQRLKSLERFAGADRRSLRRKLAATCSGRARDRTAPPAAAVQIGQLRLSFLQATPPGLEPAQPGNLLEHLIALGQRALPPRHRFLGDPAPLLGLSLEQALARRSFFSSASPRPSAARASSNSPASRVRSSMATRAGHA